MVLIIKINIFLTNFYSEVDFYWKKNALTTDFIEVKMYDFYRNMFKTSRKRAKKSLLSSQSRYDSTEVWPQRVGNLWQRCSNSVYCLVYNSYDVSLDNLDLDQLIIPWLIFFFILITCLLDVEILSWLLLEVKDYRAKTRMSVALERNVSESLWDCLYRGIV